ncbi:hypothetical protein [Adhaeribacter rhizoryzae]|uniref:hypothetical protein n=1 Tax=Adhaeribacter rhizoryzae TaxID=2607907 RepID=UPI00167FDFB6|nr:hypothetical protein [Adhaeribacter rhizoryzae]
MFDAFVVGGDATDMGQFHDFFTRNIQRVYTLFSNPQIQEGYVNANMPDVDALITN